MAEGEITTFAALTERFFPMGNFQKPRLLYCSNGGYFLRILPDGKVDGTRDRSDQYRTLLFTTPPVFDSGRSDRLQSSAILHSIID
ncbi:fibroblast growth factor 1 isoform X3 [Ambystoma mexicanum]|uniref:fibroblast growth factor 1 isoform X3 n=1 Tax=Ambystoma mexicanum TaxID=8296 RepID=UPI0037E7B86C